MASPAHKYGFSGLPELTAENIEQLDEMLDDLYTYLSTSPLGISESIFNLSELELDAGLLTIDADGDISSLSDDGVVYLNSSGEALAVTPGTTGAFLRQGTSAPEWSTLILPNAATTGDLLYASAANVMSRLVGVATGNALISGGVAAAPSWGKIGLTAHVSGILPIANGGTNKDSFTTGSVLFFDGTRIQESNTRLFWDNTNRWLGLGHATPAFPIDVRAGTDSRSPIHFNDTSADVGGYLTSIAASNIVALTCGSAYAGNWFANVANCSGIHLEAGSVKFVADSGLALSPSTHTPTVRGCIYPSGGAAFLGTIADPGAGIFKIDGSLQITTPLAVAQGGSGRASTTAYAVLCGGTTATGAQQSIASVGTSGQVLTSNGAGALPTFQNTLTEQTTTSTGTQNDFSLSASNTVLRCNNASDLTITGFTIGGAAPKAGDTVHIISIGAGNVYLAHQNSGSTAANRLINLATSGSTPIAAGTGGFATYVYDDTTDRWRLINHDQGGVIAITFSAGNFTANGSMTWTVESGDMGPFNYRLAGKFLTIYFSIAQTTVGGTANTQLLITLPNSFSCSKRFVSTIRITQDASATFNFGTLLAVASSTQLVLFVGAAEANWTLTTNQTGVEGGITFEVT